MVFKGFQFSKPTDKKNAPGAIEKKPAPKGLESLFTHPPALPEPLQEKLQQAMTSGLKAFEVYNKNRLALAYRSFDPPMKAALFDILYLLHNNGPELSEVQYTTTEIIDYKEKTIQQTADLFVEGAPTGVAGIEQMSPEILEDFEAHIEATFGNKTLAPADPEAPIRGVFSIGSVGTIGHKHLASDLDLQVVYRVHPLNQTTSELTNDQLKHRLALVQKKWAKKIQQKHKVSKEKLASDKALAHKINGAARKKLVTAYPYLCRQFLTKDIDFTARLEKQPNPKIRAQVVKEIQKLVNASEILVSGATQKRDEKALRHKIDRIQTYVMSRYPEAEVYLFPMSEQDMQSGRFSSTLESKESSGSAYELILTYDTLMPGVYFTPVVPSHFLLSPQHNERKEYHQIMDMMRFGLADGVFGEVKHQLEDQGPTPILSQEYIQGHHGCIYWEAFKASSGNLPKAMMNLLRYETLLYPETSRTIIQLVKEPQYLEQLLQQLANRPDVAEKRLLRKESQGWDESFSVEQIFHVESQFPELAFDSWWQRYKVLKVAYGEEIVGPLTLEERLDINEAIDLAFALHVRLSDVFPRSGQAYVPQMHREEVLAVYLEEAFPEGGRRRQHLEGIFIGDTHLVTDFEQKMRRVFKQSIQRISMKLEELGVEDQMSENPEMQIWFHYYQDNFEPQPHVVQPTILQHLKVPRGRVIAGYESKFGWYFKAFQKNTVRGFGQSALLSHLPEETLLIDGVSFLMGLAHCIFNGYYGVLNKGTLKESYTSFELSGTHMNLGNEVDNDYGYVQPGQIETVMHRILKLFAAQKIDYRACLMEKQRVNELFVFFNLQGCGKLSFLLRNNLGNVMVREVELKEFHENAKEYHELNRYRDVFSSSILHQAFADLLEEFDINLGDTKVETWVNDNSFETSHPLSNQARKQEDLNHEFRVALLGSVYTPLAAGDLPAYHQLESLKQVVFCGALVAAIDGDVNKKEYRLCIATLDQGWDEKWGQLDEAFTDVLKKLKHFLGVKSLLNHNINLLASNIRYQLTLDQQVAMLDLMAQMLESDAKNQSNKEALIQTFKSALEIGED